MRLPSFLCSPHRSGAFIRWRRMVLAARPTFLAMRLIHAWNIDLNPPMVAAHSRHTASRCSKTRRAQRRPHARLPEIASRLPREPYPGIKNSVHQVRDQIDERKDRDENKQSTLNHRVVAVHCRIE